MICKLRIRFMEKKSVFWVYFSQLGDKKSQIPVPVLFFILWLKQKSILPHVFSDFWSVFLAWPHLIYQTDVDSSVVSSPAHVPVTNYRNVWKRSVTHCSWCWPSIHMTNKQLNISRHFKKNSRVIRAAWNINFNVIIYFSISVQRISALVVRSFKHNQTFTKTAAETKEKNRGMFIKAAHKFPSCWP